MLQQFLFFLVFNNVFNVVISKFDEAIPAKALIVWPNATVPFFVEPDHFDHEQILSILTSLSMFAFKTCIKFKPVMARPEGQQDVMMFVNPRGIRRCGITAEGHSIDSPHYVVLGYECLKSPQIDMLIMRAIGFPFEHNRINRDLYVEVLFENIEPGAIELFTKEDTSPLEIRYLPYDFNSVMHFDTREYSKNGHRTILFKDHTVQQNRDGLSPIDLKKIEIIYGPECRKRDRQEKYELCQSYPGVARRKRQADDNKLDENDRSTTPLPEVRRKREINVEELITKSLRVNPNITPPPENRNTDVTYALKELGIDNSVQSIIDEVHKVSSEALKYVREKYCNTTSVLNLTETVRNANSSDIRKIIEDITIFVQDLVQDATNNMTVFCNETENFEMSQRSACYWSFNDPRCRPKYKSTLSGNVRHSTQHRPYISQSTRHYGIYLRANNGSHQEETETTTQAVRRKRHATPKLALEPNAESKLTKKVNDNDKAEEKRENLKDKADINDSYKSKGKHVDAKQRIDLNQGKTKEKGTEAANGKSSRRRNHRSRHRYNIHGRILEESNDENQSNLKNKKRHRHVTERITKHHRILHKSPNKNKKERKHKSLTDIKEVQPEEFNHFENTDKFFDLMEEDDYGRTPNQGQVKEESKEIIILNDDSENLQIRIEDSNDMKESVPDTRFVPDSTERLKKSTKPTRAKRVKVSEPEESESSRAPKPRKSKVIESEPGVPKTVELSKQNEDFYKLRWWPDGVVPYVIQEDTTYDLSDMRDRLAKVDSILKKKTCVRIKELTHNEAKGFEDYLIIDNSPDYVTGRVGGKQRFGSIELFQGGQHRQHAAMMVMAMLGFYFEVARHDRDSYIRVHMRHVRPDKLHHFEMIRSDATLALPYDYASATHPAWQFWRQIGKTGISTVATFKENDPDGKIMQTLGQNEKLLSDIDITKINSIYGIDCFVQTRAAESHPILQKTKSAISNSTVKAVAELKS